MPETAASRAQQMDFAVERAKAEFNKLNLLHFDGKLKQPTIEFSRRKSFGGYYQQCAHRIVLSWQAYCEYGWDETLNTLRHEIAHIVHMNHRAEFWALAVRLGVTHRYAREPIQRRRKRVLIYECPACLRRIQRQCRIRNSSCARCDKKYNPAYVFRFVEEIAP